MQDLGQQVALSSSSSIATLSNDQYCHSVMLRLDPEVTLPIRACLLLRLHSESQESKFARRLSSSLYSSLSYIHMGRSTSVVFNITPSTIHQDILKTKIFSYFPFAASNRATFTPLPGVPTISTLWNWALQSSLCSRLSYFCSILTMTYAISVRAKFWPTHILGPPLKGTYCHGRGCHWSQRSGLNSEGSANVRLV